MSDSYARMIVGTTAARGFRPPGICLDKPPQSGVPKLWRATPRADIGMRPADPAGKSHFGARSGYSAYMVKITFIENDGKSRTIDAEAGSTVMETAIKHGVPGIEAECGGACACATCHVYVDEAWREKVG